LAAGFILSLIVIFALARFLPRYNLSLVEKTELNNKGEIYYSDLDGDGASEKLNYYHYDKIFQPTLYLYDSNSDFMSLWNFFESPLEESEIFTGDYNNDSIKEIFVFTKQVDSLFLYVINPRNDKKAILKRKFITSIGITDASIEVNVLGLFNLNQAKNKELLFMVDAGYPVIPRRIFSLDISNEELNMSPELNADIIFPIVVEDINTDGELEIIVSNNSINVIGNGSESRFIVLNQNLEYLFQPTTFIGGSSKITAKTILFNDEKHIAVLHSGTNPGNIFNNLMIYNLKGEIVKELNIKNKNNLSIENIKDPYHLYLSSGKKIYKYSGELIKINTIVVSRGETVEFITQLDITEDQSNELIFRNANKLIILSKDLNYKSELNISGLGKLILSVKRDLQNTNKISFQVGSNWNLYSFSKKSDFFFSRIFYLTIFVIIMFLTLFTPWISSKLKYFIRYVVGSVENDYYFNIENNIDEKVSLLKSRVTKIGNNLKSDSFGKIIEEIDGAFEEIKIIPKKIRKQSKKQKNINDRILDLVNSKKVALNVSVKPYAEYYNLDISDEIEDLLIEYLEVYFRIISSHCNNCKLVLQIVKVNDYINLLMEVDELINVNDFTENKDVLGVLKRLNGDIELDNIKNNGTIINTSIPLNRNKSKQKKIKIIIAEDHEVSLFGLTSLFKTKNDIDIVGTAKNGMEVLKIIESKNTDIVITDISMPGMDGIELSKRLKDDYPEIRVIVFTMYLENWFIEQLVNCGTKGFVSKNSKVVELVGAVRNVYEGNNYYCPQFKSKFGFNGNNTDNTNKLDSLTKTEMQIIKLFAENCTKEQIATNMNLNKNIIDVFIANILLKLNAGDEDEIIRIAKKQKFIS